MIGYLKPDKMELVMKDYQYYKMYYCSICRHLVRNNLRIYSFLTGYEGTLMAMLYNELVVRDIDAVLDRCSGVPIAKVPVLPANHEAVELGAYVCLLAFQVKFQDNLMDESGFWITQYNRFFKKHIDRSFAKKNRAYSKFGIDLDWVLSKQKELKDLETDYTHKDINIFLNCWAETFSYIMTQPLREKLKAEQLPHFKRLFWGIAKIINLLDAMTDLHEDAQNDQFNPILRAESSFDPSNQIQLENVFKKYKNDIQTEQNTLLQRLPYLGIHESLSILKNILTHCLDKELKKVFDSMVLKKKTTERTLFNCTDF